MDSRQPVSRKRLQVGQRPQRVVEHGAFGDFQRDQARLAAVALAAFR
jgi:hypothetical protein